MESQEEFLNSLVDAQPEEVDVQPVTANRAAKPLYAPEYDGMTLDEVLSQGDAQTSASTAEAARPPASPQGDNLGVGLTPEQAMNATFGQLANLAAAKHFNILGGQVSESTPPSYSHMAAPQPERTAGPFRRKSRVTILPNPQLPAAPERIALPSSQPMVLAAGGESNIEEYETSGIRELFNRKVVAAVAVGALVGLAVLGIKANAGASDDTPSPADTEGAAQVGLATEKPHKKPSKPKSPHASPSASAATVTHNEPSAEPSAQPSSQPSVTPTPTQAAVPSIPTETVPAPVPPVETPEVFRPVPIKAMTYNVLGASHTDSKDANHPEYADSSVRMKDVTIVIGNNVPDVVFFQEFEQPQRQQLMSVPFIQDNYQIFPQNPNYGPGGNISAASILISNRFEVVETGDRSYPYFAGENRVPYILVKDKENHGKRVLFTNDHPPADTAAFPNNTEKRGVAAHKLLEFSIAWEDRGEGNITQIVGTDSNSSSVVRTGKDYADPDKLPCRIVTRGPLDDVADLVFGGNGDCTTAAQHEDGGDIERFLVSHATVSNLKQIVNPNTQEASDHFPRMVEITPEIEEEQ